MAPHNKNQIPSNKRGRNKKESNSKRVTTIHHIVPKSRGGKETKENKSLIMVYFHKKYHELFRNMTPTEILAYLETYFWNNQTKWIDDYSFNRQNYIDNLDDLK
ncbi:MAG TPA: HNH endonuclease [bacterium]|nr:HNH endonuclease [bacterium]